MNKTLKVIALVCHVITGWSATLAATLAAALAATLAAALAATLAATSAAVVVSWLVMRQSAKRGKKVLKR